MRYGIFSDVHSNMEAIEAVIGAYKNESIDLYICVGDVVGYAANPNECVDAVRNLCAASVAGNHDLACVDLFPHSYFNSNAIEAVIWTKRVMNNNTNTYLRSLKLIYQNRDLTLAHGTLNGPEKFDYMADIDAASESFPLLETKVCFVGHTHQPGIFVKDASGRIRYARDKKILLNDNSSYIVDVGSVGQPRDGDPKAAYCVYDTVSKVIEIKRQSYDADSTRKKIIEVGLPRFLGDRLLTGN